MDKFPIDLSALPEPFKSMVNNLDPQTIEKMLTSYDPATLSIMMNSMFSMFKDSLPADQVEALKEMMDNILQMLPQKK
ncbi:MAG: hypothetical protein ACYC4H_11130 [Desulfocucumaceae bacterium]